MKTDLRKKTGHAGAPRLKSGRKIRGEPRKNSANPYCIPPRRWFLIFMCINIPIMGWVYLICLTFGKGESQLRGFTKAYLIYKLVFLAAVLATLGALIYIGLDFADRLLTYMETL